MDRSYDFNNHWFAGLSDAKASFIINTDINNIYKVNLNYHINISDNKVLLMMLAHLMNSELFYSGNPLERQVDSTEKHNFYTISFNSVTKLINYFDNYHLLSQKHINFLKRFFLQLQAISLYGLLRPINSLI